MLGRETGARGSWWQGAIVAVLAAAAIGCGVGPETGGGAPGDVETVRSALGVSWPSTGTETDVSPAFGAFFGSTVSTNGTSIAATRLPVSGSGLGTTQVWQHTTTGWLPTFSWPTQGADHHPVAVLGPSWLWIGEPCNQDTAGCAGRLYGFWFNGTSWFELVQVVSSSNAWDFGSALAWDENTQILAVAGGGSVSVYTATPSFFGFEYALSQPSSPYLGSGFGSAVAVTKNAIAVSAPGGERLVISRPRGPIQIIRSPGYVYLFGSSVTTLTGVGAEGPSGSPSFGASLSASLDGTSLAVGAGHEVGRDLTTYVYRLGSTGTWSLSNTILAPSGATGTDISVGIDNYLAITTDAPGSTTAATLQFYQLGGFLGPTLDATISLTDGVTAPVSLRAGRAIVGQPDFFGDVGYIGTYAASSAVIVAQGLGSGLTTAAAAPAAAP
jgi:hypothetical protein